MRTPRRSRAGCETKSLTVSGKHARFGTKLPSSTRGRLAARMNLERVTEALAPTDVVHRAPVEVLDLAYDTRGVGPGSLFFCVRGERHDGHDFAAAAVERGAAALVV